MANITKQSRHQIDLVIDNNDDGKRLDKVLASHLNDISRSMIQSWITQGHAKLNGNTCKPRQAVFPGQAVHINIPETPVLKVMPQTIKLDIVFEDSSLLVINKPAGLVVHPGAGNHSGTLLNGLLAYNTNLAHLARGGIVHRLDKQTSGLMVVAKTEKTRQRLIKQLSHRSVKREYQALVYGVFLAGGTINAPIGRHPRDRRKMIVRDDGKPAITHYRIAKKFISTSLLKVFLETGRTHQIRVHMAHQHMPLVGDPVYGSRLQFPKGASELVKNEMRGFKRQALHARQLGLIHPETQEKILWQAPMPEDMRNLCAALDKDSQT